MDRGEEGANCSAEAAAGPSRAGRSGGGGMYAASDALVGPNARLANARRSTRYSGAYLPSASLVLAGSLIAGGGGDDDDAPPGLRRIVRALHRFVSSPLWGPVLYLDSRRSVCSRRRARRRSFGFSY